MPITYKTCLTVGCTRKFREEKKNQVFCWKCLADIERQAWLRQVGNKMDDFNMKTTGCKKLDSDIKDAKDG